MIKETTEKYDLYIQNLDLTRSKRNFNAYHIAYPSNYDKKHMKDIVIVETAFQIQSFPFSKRNAQTLIFDFLSDIKRIDIAKQFQLEPFEINVQSIERTFIDKVFAICDYKVSGRITEHSRHLYDLHQLIEHIVIDEKFCDLIKTVRKARQSSIICYSAQEGFNVNETLKEIIDTRIYEDDYQNITMPLLFEKVTYESTIEVIRKIINYHIF